jgi:hypothetical protein
MTPIDELCESASSEAKIKTPIVIKKLTLRLTASFI